MSERTTTILLDGLAFPEGPRWHEGRLFFSDQHDRRVLAMSEGGQAETIVEVPQQPSGLGWLPDGRMLVVSMLDRRVLRLEDDQLVEHADLSSLAPGECNDMVVDTHGRAYVGNFGFDMYGGESARDTCMIVVEPDGSARVAADGLAFPNGTVITDGGFTLIVGESYAGRLSAFTITGDGALVARRLFAQLDGAVPDGICLDAEGAVWVACPLTGRCLRVREGGEVLDEIDVANDFAYACMLGGDDRRTLYMCTAASSDPKETIRSRSGHIEAMQVDVPGAGLP
ncbi:MAG: SMP-30/gluconolactonase/LRE family protein [Acidimicrobiia bacterium]